MKVYAVDAVMMFWVVQITVVLKAENKTESSTQAIILVVFLIEWLIKAKRREERWKCRNTRG